MDYNLTFTLGDYSDDGHGKTETINLKANLPAELIGKAYKKAMADTGIKPHDDWARGYEERDFDAPKLIAAGVPESIVKGDDGLNTNAEDPEDFVILSHEHYVNLIIAFCKLGNPNVEMGIVHPDHQPDLRRHLGETQHDGHGYGLFN